MMTLERRQDASQVKPRILSLQSPFLGHQTIGQMIRQHLTDAPQCTVDSHWVTEERSLGTRLVNRLAHQPLPGNWVRRNNADIFKFRAQMGMSYLGRVLAERLVRNERYDALHFHTQELAYLSTGLARRLPTIITGDMTAVQAAQESRYPGWTERPHIAQERRIFSILARLIFFSDWAARSAVRDLGAAPEKVSVVHPGVDVRAFEIGRPAGSIEEPFRLLFVGGAFERKGGFDVLDVFLRDLLPRAERGDGPRLELNLVTGDLLPDDLPPSIRVHRGVKAYSPEWLKLYRQADIFVLPTRWEAYGLVFAEAMAAGLPVVATQLNAIPEIVLDGETGSLIKPGDKNALAGALRALISDATLRRRLGLAGRRRAETHFEAEAAFKRLGDIFAETAHAAQLKRTEIS